jgi:5-aminolevulinate synthase
VPRGTERLRITPTPCHDETLILALRDALIDVWQRLWLPMGRTAPANTGRVAAAAGGVSRFEVFPPAGG